MHPVALVSASFVAGIALAPWAGGPAHGWQLAAIALVALGGCFSPRVSEPRPVGAGHVLLALAAAAAGVATVRAEPDGPVWSGRVVAEAVVSGAPSGHSVDLAVARWKGGDGWVDAVGSVRALFPSDRPVALAPGSAWLVSGVAGPYPGVVLPGSPDPVRAAARSRIHSWLAVDAFEPIGPRPAAPRPLDDPTGLIRAFVLGDVAGVSDEELEILRNTGTVHLLSVSGFHVGVLAGLVAALLEPVPRALGTVRPRGLSTAPALALAAALGASFAWLVGAPISAQRAALGLVIATAGRALGREIDPLAALGVAAALVAFRDPASVGTPSFQLSFGALLGMIRVTPALLRWLPPDGPRVARWPAEALAATIGALVGTLPASTWWFQAVPKLALPANLLALPLGSVLVPLSAMAVFSPWEALSHPCAVLATAGARLLLALLAPLAVEPWHPAVGPAGALALLLLALLPRLPVSWLVAAVALGPRWEVPSVPTATFLSVGQGDAILLEEPGGRRILVDGGPPGDAVLRWLRRTGRTELDAVVVTHGHLDHYGGLIPIVSALSIGEIGFRDATNLEALRAAAAPHGVGLAWWLDALAPAPGFSPKDLNDRSIVTRWGDLLLAGDLQQEGEEAIAGIDVSSAVLKVGHHGSAGASSDAFLCAVRPAVGVISSGRGNHYGHPHAAAIRRLIEHGIRVLRTDVDGTIEMAFHLDHVDVRTWRPGEGWSPADPIPTGPEWRGRGCPSISPAASR